MQSSVPAVVVLSGGQDSATCLAIAKQEHEKIHAISFDYGQKHYVELECAQQIGTRWNVPVTVVKLSMLKDLVTSALLDPTADVNAKHPRLTSLPASFVPTRNALFLTLAHAMAQELGADSIYTGVCQTDYSGYPDCRLVFINALQNALNVGYDAEILIKTPLMFANKADTFRMAFELGVLSDILLYTHTCYNGDRTNLHEWGYGCGSCPACVLRARGYADFIRTQ